MFMRENHSYYKISIWIVLLMIITPRKIIFEIVKMYMILSKKSFLNSFIEDAIDEIYCDEEILKYWILIKRETENLTFDLKIS